MPPDTAAVARATRSRLAQGLPPTIEDPVTLDRVAAIFRAVAVEKRAPTPAKRREIRAPACATATAERAAVA